MGKDATRSYRPTTRHYVGLDKTKRHNPIKKSGQEPKKSKKMKPGKPVSCLPLSGSRKISDPSLPVSFNDLYWSIKLTKNFLE